MSREMVFIPKYKYDRLIKDFENKQLNDEHHGKKPQEDHTEETFTTENDIKPQNKDDVEGQKVDMDEHQETKIHNENLNGVETEKSQSYLKMSPSTFLKVKQPKSKMRNAGVKTMKRSQTRTKWLTFKM